jgi:hypothetical protein
MARSPLTGRPHRVVARGGEHNGAGVSERVKTVLSVVSPLALGTMLLFYFGWVRTKTEAAALGYDSKILEFGTADYVLRSINVLSLPLVAALVLVLVLLRGHHWLTTRLTRPARARLARGLTRTWLLCLLIWAVLVAFAPPAVAPALPPLLTCAVGCALYGDHLRGGTWTLPFRAVVIALLIIAVIADTERLARAMGEGFAAGVAAEPQQLAVVDVYSAKDLAITVPNVTVTRLGGPGPAYQFHYSGLRLLQRSGDKYLLINDGWNPATGRVLMLHNTDDIRLEFRR